MNAENQSPKKSVLGRLGVSMGAIVSFAMASILISTIFTEMSSGKGQAINVAGSLRMHAFLLSSQLTRPGLSDEERTALIRDSVGVFEKRITDPALAAGVRSDQDTNLSLSYRRIVQRWHKEVRPLVLAGATDSAKRVHYVATVGAFVLEIDRLVKLLELDLETKIQWLRLVQGISLFMIVGVVLVTMYLMHTQILMPLNDLLDCARAVRRGNFDVRAQHTGGDELGQLGFAFNTMVVDLSQMYANLEARVAQKTEELALSNQSLELLYGIVRTLSEHRVGNEALTQVLREIERVLDVPAGAICACSPDVRQGLPLAAVVNRPGASGAGNGPEVWATRNCAQCIGDGRLHIQPAQAWQPDAPEGTRIVSVPLTDGGRNYGVMPLELPPGKELASWQLQLLEAVGRHVGAALAMAQRTEEQHRLALFEERTIIARELHDSLAQSLTYLKIQVTRMQAMLAKGAPTATIGEVVGELKSGLANAYRQLRELLTTFRLRIDGRGLNAALEETAREFIRHGVVNITLNNHLLGVELASNEEIHVLQVIRESLSNIEHHAHARHAEVTLERLPDHRVRVRIDDDGVGIGEVTPRPHHYGLGIMRDRAASLKGSVSIARRPEGGTRVELEFTPVTPYGGAHGVEKAA